MSQPAANDCHSAVPDVLGPGHRLVLVGTGVDVTSSTLRTTPTNLFVLPSTSPANAGMPRVERRRWIRALAAPVGSAGVTINQGGVDA